MGRPTPDVRAAATATRSRPREGERPTLSVVIPVVERADDFEQLNATFAPQFAAFDPAYEMVFVLDGAFGPPPDRLLSLARHNPHIRVLTLAHAFGETGALRAGLAESRGDIIVTLPSYFQVTAAAIPALLAELEDGADLAVAKRFPRRDSWINRLQSRVFHWMVRGLSGARFGDIACGARALRREVADELPLYGDLHRFIPAIARHQGFRVAEVPTPQHPADTQRRTYPVGTYVRRVLDVFALLFLLRFTEKPLRFFGLIGLALAGSGAVVCLILAWQRLGGTGLANRPMLLGGVLLIALGVQIAALGLVGEIVVHWRAPHRRTYRVKRVVPDPDGPAAPSSD